MIIELELKDEHKHLMKNPEVAKWLKECEDIINQKLSKHYIDLIAFGYSELEIGGEHENTS